MLADIHKESTQKMNKTIEVIAAELSAVRTGRASADILRPVMVDYYGTPTPLTQLASINTPDPQLIVVTPYDPSALKGMVKGINSSDLGLNSIAEGGVIRVPIPVLTEERRKDLVKHVRKLGEDGKIAIRNIRRDCNEQVKKLEKNKEISQDEEKAAQDKIQHETDAHIKQIDDLVRKKEHDLMTV
jgi:ribosome recycling factor